MISGQKIVLVEDDEILAKVLASELKDAGFEVSQAFDGEAGLELVKSEKPDLVLLDLILPKKHGFVVLEELKKSPETQRIPVIILTLLGEDDDIKKGLQLGASDYLVKSSHPVGEIVDKVKSFFVRESHPGTVPPPAVIHGGNSRKAAVDPQLSAYIKEQMSQGITKEALRNKLLIAGWQPDIVDKALS